MRDHFIILSFFSLLVHQTSAQQDYYQNRWLYAKEVLEKGQKLNDSTLLAEGHYLLGKREKDKGRYVESYQHFYEALRIHKNRGDHAATGKVYLALASLELRFNNSGKALSYTKDAVANLSIPDGVASQLASAFNVTGNIYYERINQMFSDEMDSNIDSALSYYLRTEAILIKEKKSNDLLKIRNRIGELYALKKDQRAIPYLEMAIQDFNRKDSLTFRDEINKADAWRVLGNKIKMEEALEEVKKLIVGHRDSPIDYLAKYHKVYADYYTEQKDYEKAYFHTQNIISYMQRAAEADREGYVSRWRVELETYKKEQELKLKKERIDHHQSRIRMQQFFIAILLLLIITILFLSYYLYTAYHRQKALRKKNDLLMQEQNHRVKNNLQVISSLLNLQADFLRNKEVHDVLQESQTRINAMVLLHRQLYENDDIAYIDFRMFLKDVARSVAEMHGESNLILEQKVNPEFLKPDLAISVGLIFNELLVNSFKYVFAHREGARADLCVEENSKGLITLVYKDFGQKDLTAIMQKEEKETFGLSLIEMILFQINGRLDYAFEDGSVFTLQFKNV